MNIILHSPSHFERWDYRNPDTVGIGGSETSAIEMAIRLAARGHDVTSYSPLPADCPDREYAGVHWRDLSECDFTAPGFWMLYRCPDAVDKFDPTRTDQRKWLICQDEDYHSWMEGLTEPTLARSRQDGLQRVVALCQAQAAQYRDRYPRMAKKVCVSSNGIKGELVDRVLANTRRGSRNPKRILFASSPDRGLAPLLWIFDRARETVPDLELYVAYGFDNIDKIAAKVEATPEAERDPGDARWLKWLHKLKADLRAPGITLTGRLPQPKLYELWTQCGLWVCATRFRETSCQPAGSLIFTRKGMVPIENIKVGDEVLTHKGRFRKVTELKQRHHQGKMLAIQRRKDGRPIYVTPDHPVLVLRANQGAVHKGHVIKHRLVVSEATWVPASEVRPEQDFMLTPRPQAETERSSIRLSDYVDYPVINGMISPDHNRPLYKAIKNEIELTEEFGYVLGVYVAEGCVSFKQGATCLIGSLIQTAHHSSETVIADRITAFFGGSVRKRTDSDCIQTESYSAVWAKFLHTVTHGKQRDRCIPEFIWDAPKEFQLSFIQGLMDGDGCYIQDCDRMSLTTASASLAHSVSVLLTLHGVFPAINYNRQRDTYELMWQPHGTKPRHLWHDDFVATLVQSVTESEFDNTVYNFEVDEDHSYVTNRTIVHNCITSQESQALGGIPIVLPIWAVGENVEHGTHVTDILPCTPLTARAPLNESLVACRFVHEVVRWASNPVAQEWTRAQMMPWARQHFHWDRFVSQWEAWMREEIQP